jgi:hypothetical protein
MRPTVWIGTVIIAPAMLVPVRSAPAQSESQITLPGIGSKEWLILWAVLASAFIALAYGYYLAQKLSGKNQALRGWLRWLRPLKKGR